ncbi:hypothetical protein [Planctomicrobium piriforme]|uniref:Lipoprotein n=1 Tax=Planctomicrobium piriforme TaxID=1576369 RepID=A0A1I3G3M7_9PLAN|nr:hypothetical protein [Planctomicrobium piriforme]SFI17771.1 hypothetical protein SAMN05421753_106150 [Planctomicrobium piriforme]
MLTIRSTSFRTRVYRLGVWCTLWLTCLGMSGCSQFVILSYLIHGPPTIEPDFDAETGKSLTKPDTTVAVVCFAPKELQWKFPQIDDQLATAVSYRLGQNHVTMIHPDYVKAWTDAHPDWEKAAEIGKAFNATYVIEIELAAFSLHEGTSTTLYRGKTEAYVHVVEMDPEGSGDGERIFTKELDFEFPTRVPRSSYDQTLNSFQKEYLSMLSERIGFLFYERFAGDMIPWAS